MRLEVSGAPAGAAGAPKEQKPLEKQRKFSIRGVFFITFYSWMASVAALLIMIDVDKWVKTFRREIAEPYVIIMDVCWLLACKGMLVFHSSVSHAPHMQPYRSTCFLARFIMCFAAVGQLLMLRRVFPDIIS